MVRPASSQAPASTWLRSVAQQAEYLKALVGSPADSSSATSSNVIVISAPPCISLSRRPSYFAITGSSMRSPTLARDQAVARTHSRSRQRLRGKAASVR